MVVSVFILMGTCGSGKSLIGNLISQELCIPFIDGDEFHSSSNIQKMKAGIPLSDEDREPWLNDIKTKFIILSNSPSIKHIIVACSALKRQYRERLRNVPDRNIEVWFVYLKGNNQQLKQRLTERKDHFMQVNMLNSQLETLEEPDDNIEERIIVVDVVEDANKIKDEILKRLMLNNKQTRIY